MKVPGWICVHENGEVDHDWKVMHDWAGDPSVPGGTTGWSYRVCEQCGEEAEAEPVAGECDE